MSKPVYCIHETNKIKFKKDVLKFKPLVSGNVTIFANRVFVDVSELISGY